MINIQNKKIFLQFGGQGVPWLQELLFLKQNDKMQNFFSVVVEAIKEELPNVQNSSVLPNGFDIDHWLSGEPIEKSDYLFSAPISLPMIFITQIAHFEHFLILSELKRENFLQKVLGITGHSQGVIAGVFVSMDKRKQEYYSTLKHFVKYMLYLGIRAQESLPNTQTTDVEIEKTRKLPGGRKLKPSPMVAVLGVSRDFLQPILDNFNKNLDENSHIYLCLYNSPMNTILSSKISSLVSFHEHIASYIEEKKLKYVYLKTTCPFHSIYMENMVSPFLQDCENLAFHYFSTDMNIPTYSFEDGENIQNKNVLLSEHLCRALMTETLYWSQALSCIKNKKSITNILDFGPGKSIVGLTQEILSSNNINNLTVYPVVTVKNQKLVEKAFAS